MPSAVFVTSIPAIERVQTNALDRMAIRVERRIKYIAWFFKEATTGLHMYWFVGVFHLTTLSVDKIILRRWLMNEWAWGIGRMILTGGNRSAPRKHLSEWQLFHDLSHADWARNEPVPQKWQTRGWIYETCDGNTFADVMVSTAVVFIRDISAIKE